MKCDAFSSFQARPRRVLMTADTVGGVWTYALELARALGEFDVEVALATMGAPLCSAQWREAERIPTLEVFESQYQLEWMTDPWDDVQRAGEWLLDLEQRLQPDLVHLNGYAHAVLPFSAPKLVVAHSCVLSWWQAVKGEDAPIEWERYRRAVSAGLHAANEIIAPSRAMLREIQRFYGPLPHGDVVPNGRELPFVFDRSIKERFILSAGRLWDEAKGIQDLADIAGDLPWPVCVAGDATAPHGDELDVSGVQWLGRLAPGQLLPWQARASIYALPARYEPFGLSVLEAALAGCALVLGDIPSLRENWDDAAIFVKPGDPELLRQSIALLIEDRDLRSDLAARANARAQSFTPGKMAAGYLAAYNELLASRFRAGDAAFASKKTNCASQWAGEPV